MKYRKLSRTGVDVSELVFSCAETVGLLTSGNYDTALEAVRRALDAGINWFDTSPSDTGGEAEVILGRILKELDAHPHISAKVEINPGASEEIFVQIERALEQTLERLQIEQIDLF